VIRKEEGQATAEPGIRAHDDRAKAQTRLGGHRAELMGNINLPF